MHVEDERAARDQAIRFLRQRSGSAGDVHWTRQELSLFEYEGHRIPLMDPQRGIRKPKDFNSALSIRTTFTAPGGSPPYADEVGADGLQRYKYRGTDPNHHENVALRRAMEAGDPLIWFVGIQRGVYYPIYPVWIVGEEPAQCQFILAVDESQRTIQAGQLGIVTDEREYRERITRERVHQPAFRARVLSAYGRRCAICRLAHPELLDAAHIIADGEELGLPVVPNGLALCKIHHATYDVGILGIRPDLTLHVRSDVLDEVDGWMLRGGIQGVHNQRLEVLPKRRAERPDPVRLEARYAQFVSYKGK